MLYVKDHFTASIVNMIMLLVLRILEDVIVKNIIIREGYILHLGKILEIIH